MAKKKVFLSPSDQWGNVYATYGTREQVECEKIAAAAKVALERSGVEVMVAVNDKDWTYEHVTVSNNWKPDLHIPVHTNALNGKTGGTQVYYGAIGMDKAKIMLKEISSVFPDTLPHSAEKVDGSYGQKQNWAEMTKVSAYTLYCECNFHDVPVISDFICTHITEIGEAIARGACKVLSVPFVEAPKPVTPEQKKLYRVQVGAFNVKANADAYMKKLTDAGFPAFIVEV